MVKLLSYLFIVIGIFMSSSTLAQEQACIERKDKAIACERLLIKKTDPRVQMSSKASSPTVCICVSDFEHIVNSEATVSLTTQQAVEEVLSEWQLTEQQLLQLLRY